MKIRKIHMSFSFEFIWYPVRFIIFKPNAVIVKPYVKRQFRGRIKCLAVICVSTPLLSLYFRGLHRI